MKWFKKILLFVFIVFLYALPSLIFKTDQEFYNNLKGPKLPTYIFPIAWGIIFILLGIFLTWHITNRKSYNKKDFLRMMLFIVINYGLNFLFPYVFFIEKNLFISYVVTLFSLLSISLACIESLLLNKKSSLLLLPNIIWLIIASVFAILLYLNN